MANQGVTHMNRQELIDTLAKKTGCTKADAKRYLLALIAIITSALMKGDTVVLAGFGSFEVRRRAARVGRNPKTGADLKIKSSKVPAFKAGATLKATVSKSDKIDTSVDISHFGYAGVTGARPKVRVHTEFALQRENTLEDAVDTSTNDRENPLALAMGRKAGI